MFLSEFDGSRLDFQCPVLRAVPYQGVQGALWFVIDLLERPIYPAP